MTTYSFQHLSPSDYRYQTLKISSVHDGKLRIITFSRPDKFNALSPLAYQEWLWAMNEAGLDTNIIATIITGLGPYYSSGNQLLPITHQQHVFILHLRHLVQQNPSIRLLDDDIPLPTNHNCDDMDIIQRGIITRQLVSCLIHFPKLLVAGVNGPAIGFACTTLTLFDFVFTTDNAYFHTPFMQLGFCAEGTSSVMFPKILGPQIAHNMLYLGHKYKAKQLLPSGFITEILPTDTFHHVLIQRVTDMIQQLPLESFIITKSLLRHNDKQLLDQVNAREMNALVARMVSLECEQRINSFFMNMKSKSKSLTDVADTTTTTTNNNNNHLKPKL